MIWDATETCRCSEKAERDRIRAAGPIVITCHKAVDDATAHQGLAFVFCSLGCLMLIVNYALSFPLRAITPIGWWYGMTAAWEDVLSILFVAVQWQWPWIPLGIYCTSGKARRIRQASTSAVC